jgi:ssDNA-binding Zn-finger/Zn-ribbon topoisomerase 1
MSAHLCPECRQVGFTWSIDEHEPDLTRWQCAVCRYSAEEDEAEQGSCPACGGQSAVRLRDRAESYRYCLVCHARWSVNSQRL